MTIANFPYTTSRLENTQSVLTCCCASVFVFSRCSVLTVLPETEFCCFEELFVGKRQNIPALHNWNSWLKEGVPTENQGSMGHCSCGECGLSNRWKRP
jgi:hypothetical protein